ncbi:MAG: PilX N-terminal domain-containing pilus assembly protein [Candidatus Acidiferrum sp.]
MRNKNEQGMALILALILVLVLSVMAVSLLFVARTDTWSSMNYRAMTRGRYAAESGISATANFLMFNYAPPGAASDPITSYDTTKSPVTLAGNATPVALAASGSTAPNGNTYPSSSVRSAFQAAAAGTLSGGNTSASSTYTPYATLLSMKQFNAYPGSIPTTIQTWEITSDGDVAGIRKARVEVSAVLEREASPVFAYAAFATSNGCGALGFGGGGTTDSYDSSQYAGSGSVSLQNSGGNVGTNGNLAASGSKTTINGSLSTPRAGVGSCSSSSVTALSTNGNATVTGGVTELPQPIVYPPPPAPSPAPPQTGMSVQKKADCTGVPNCSASGTDTIITGGSTSNPTLLGNLSVNSGAVLHFAPPASYSPGSNPNSPNPVVFNINSVSFTGNATVQIDPIPGTTPAQYAPILLNFAGTGVSTPIDFTGGTIANPTLNSGLFQIQYAGTGNVVLTGGAGAAGVLYAPNASVKFTGGGDWYGAVISQYVTDLGGAAIHYDRHLQTEYFMAGPFILSTFNWKSF